MDNMQDISNINRVISCINKANYFLKTAVGEIAKHCLVVNNYGTYLEVWDDSNYNPTEILDSFSIYTSVKRNDQIIREVLYFPLDYLKSDDDFIILDWYHHELEKIKNIIMSQRNYHENELKKLHAGEILVESYIKKSITFE